MARKRKQKPLNLQALSAQLGRLAIHGDKKYRKLCAALQDATNAAAEIGIQADANFMRQTTAETIVALLAIAAGGDARLAFETLFESLEK